MGYDIYNYKDKPFPSCLILGFTDDKGLHVVCSVGQGGLKTRRKD